MPHLTLRQKKAIASVEQSGDITGDYAQLTRKVLVDAQQQGLFKGIKFSDIKRDGKVVNEKLYDNLVAWYLNVRIPQLWPNLKSLKDRVIALYKPSVWSKYKDRVDEIPNPKDRAVFKSRLKNYRDPGELATAVEEKLLMSGKEVKGEQE